MRAFFDPYFSAIGLAQTDFFLNFSKQVYFRAKMKKSEGKCRLSPEYRSIMLNFG